MSLSVKPLLCNLGNMSRDLTQKKKDLKAFADDVDFLKEIKEKMVQDLQKDNKLDWETSPFRALLDRLYDFEAFQAYERIYSFDDIQKAVPLVQHIEEQFNNQLEKLQTRRNIVMKKESNLDQFQSEILRIINQLSQCMSIVNR